MILLFWIKSQEFNLDFRFIGQITIFLAPPPAPIFRLSEFLISWMKKMGTIQSSSDLPSLIGFKFKFTKKFSLWTFDIQFLFTCNLNRPINYIAKFINFPHSLKAGILLQQWHSDTCNCEWKHSCNLHFRIVMLYA